MRLANEIIDDMNDVLADIEDAGETFIDVLVDAREDEGLPPYTPEQIDILQKQCDENADKVTALEHRLDDLRYEYLDAFGKFPHYIAGWNRYSLI